MNKTGLRYLATLLLLFFQVVFPADAMAEEASGIQVRSLEVIRKDSEGVELRSPSVLYYDPELDETYAAVGGDSRLVVYGGDYFPELVIGAGRGISPVSGVYIHEGLLFACVGPGPESPGHIAVLNRALLPVRKIYFSGFEGAETYSPKDLVVGQNKNLYVVDGRGPVIVFNPEGQYLRSIDPVTDALGVQENVPVAALDRDAEGRLYFLSEASSKVFVYGADEEFLFSFGEKGGTRGKLSRPRGMDVDDRNRRLYIVDYMRHSVAAFDLKGQFLFEFGGKGVGRGWFQYPSDVVVDGRGNILVADTFNHRIQVFRLDDKQADERPESPAVADLGEVPPVDSSPAEPVAKVEEPATDFPSADGIPAPPAFAGGAASAPVVGAVEGETFPMGTGETEDVASSSDPPDSQTSAVEFDAVVSEGEAEKIFPIGPFGYNDWKLSEEAKASLRRIWENVRDAAPFSVRVQGHSDSLGAQDYNRRLSLHRARLVAEYFRKLSGIGEEDFRIEGLGESSSQAENLTPEGRAENRRVDLILIEKE